MSEAGLSLVGLHILFNKETQIHYEIITALNVLLRTGLQSNKALYYLATISDGLWMH